MSLITPTKGKNIDPNADNNDRKRSIAYSMDLLIPGLYVWLGSFTLRIGGEVPDDRPYRYPGTLNSRYGIALVLPGYRILTTSKNSYDPR
jgi:hypothetical protein